MLVRNSNTSLKSAFGGSTFVNLLKGFINVIDKKTQIEVCDLLVETLAIPNMGGKPSSHTEFIRMDLASKNAILTHLNINPDTDTFLQGSGVDKISTFTDGTKDANGQFNYVGVPQMKLNGLTVVINSQSKTFSPTCQLQVYYEMKLGYENAVYTSVKFGGQRIKNESITLKGVRCAWLSTDPTVQAVFYMETACLWSDTLIAGTPLTSITMDDATKRYNDAEVAQGTNYLWVFDSESVNGYACPLKLKAFYTQQAIESPRLDQAIKDVYKGVSPVIGVSVGAEPQKPATLPQQVWDALTPAQKIAMQG